MLLYSLFFWTYFFFFLTVMFLLSFPLVLFPKRGVNIFYFLVRMLLRSLFAICFIRVKVCGEENLLPDARQVLVANHSSLIAPLYLIAYFPLRLRYVVREGLYKAPLYGRILKVLGCIPYPADKQSKKAAFSFAHSFFNAMRNKEPVCFFPANLRKGAKGFDESVLAISRKAEAHLVLIELKGMEQVMPGRGMMMSPGKVEVIIGVSGNS